mmetsp:Transcript_54749/g.123274  ORF Transcript_54749/g.123274 Transcript_54749/m.123274 type:complete len:227 (-) Transcript_54749:1358-2038(-)
MPRLPLYKCFGFKSGMCLSASPFLPSFSMYLILFLRTFSAFSAASSDGKPRMRLLLRAEAADAARVPATEPSRTLSSPALAARFRLPRRDCSGLLRETDLPRTLDESMPLLVSSSTTSSTLLPFFRRTGRPFLDFASRLVSFFCAILLWACSRIRIVLRAVVRTVSSSRTFSSSRSKASSRSSSASLLSMSGSTKSATLCPSMISGTTSYFQVVSSRIAFLQRSTE